MVEKKLKKIPQRKCSSCGLKKDKNNLLRIVRNDCGISLDLSGKMNGRGAYICKDSKCINDAIKKNKLSNILKTDIPNSLLEEIKLYVLDG